MAIDVARLEAAFRRNRRARGVAVSAAFDRAVEALLVQHQVGLWERAADKAVYVLKSGGYFADAGAADVDRVVQQVYNQHTNIDALEGKLREAFERGDEIHKARYIAELRKAVGVSVADLLNGGSAKSQVESGITRSINLIRTLTPEMSARLGQEIWRGISEGRDEFSLRKWILEERKGLPEWRARLIARDQTGKLFSKLSEVRQTDIGIVEYRWRTVGDGAVRDSHEALNNTLQKWAEPPEPGHPGEDIQCRCVADPVLENAKIY